jgi:hypothetical protein
MQLNKVGTSPYQELLGMQLNKAGTSPYQEVLGNAAE